ncbi:hypothetical protein GWK47_021694 [Chionoecetes opilio]|uniref:Uncharacterized protein n=1 Tax=Chionoecetes opilio TaxID=41210 RepID=A0A8J4XNY3_CHIOP|nr:hypothetical protein GWK47_021694 [Chionoecetes opilio]
MTLFDNRHADAFDLSPVTGDRQFLLGQRLPGWTPWHHARRSTNPWPTESKRRLERRRAKAVELTGACHDCHAQLHRAWVQAPEEENGGDDGRDVALRSERRNIRSIGLFPQASPHPDHDALVPDHDPDPDLTMT